MTLRAEGLPIRTVPEQLGVAAVRHSVVDDLGRSRELAIFVHLLPLVILRLWMKRITRSARDKPLCRQDGLRGLPAV